MFVSGMEQSLDLYIIIPAYNEERSIPRVIRDIPKALVRRKRILVIDNNSSDKTAKVADMEGATVLKEPRQGYGYACLKGIEYIKSKSRDPEMVVFLDADYSDYPQELPKVIGPIMAGEADLVIGSRALGKREKGSMTPQQLFGNWLATKLIKWLYGVTYTDLGPFRAIRYKTLLDMDMQDKTYGWTVEMQLKAAKMGVKVKEVPVSYRKRIGVSKVSGTVKGTIMAGYKILDWIFKYR